MKKLLLAVLPMAIVAVSQASEKKISESGNVQQRISYNTNTSSFNSDSASAMDQPIKGCYPNLIYKNRLDSIQQSVPLNYNRHVEGYINLYVNHRKSQIGKMAGLGKYYFPIFEKALKIHNVPQEIKFLTIVESSMNPFAVSRVGATGLWQFMYATAKGYGLKIDNYVDERRDPVQASYAAAAYLRNAYNEFGDWLLAIASYNCGKGNVKKAIRRAGSNNFWVIMPYLPRETRNYVPAFIAATYAMNYYTQHGIEAIESDGLSQVDAVYVNRPISLKSIAATMNLSLAHLIKLNPEYKKQIVNGSTNEPRRLVLPKMTNNQYEAVYAILNPSLEHKEDVKTLMAGNIEEIPEKAAYHKVRKGESLHTIADKYGIEVQDIKAWNKLRLSRIVPGQRLKVSDVKYTVTSSEKSKTYITYTVKRGDTISEIVNKFKGTSVNTIKALNGLKSSQLQVGAVLKINKG